MGSHGHRCWRQEESAPCWDPPCPQACRAPPCSPLCGTPSGLLQRKTWLPSLWAWQRLPSTSSGELAAMEWCLLDTLYQQHAAVCLPFTAASSQTAPTGSLKGLCMCPSMCVVLPTSFLCLVLPLHAMPSLQPSRRLTALLARPSRASFLRLPCQQSSSRLLLRLLACALIVLNVWHWLCVQGVQV